MPRRSQRIRKRPSKEDFVYDSAWRVPRDRVETSDQWPVLEVLEHIDENHVKVRWAPTGTKTWPDSVVDLRYNQDLKDRLERNCCNPQMKVFKKQQMAIDKPRELRVLRQQIFDNLGYRYTPSREGHTRRIHLTVPLSETSFRSLFLQQLSIPLCQELLEEHPLENCFGGRGISVPSDKMSEMDAILGENWDVRTFQTNTVCRVIREEGVHVSWGYKKREIFSHSECPRCNWTPTSGASRPEMCTTTVSYFVGEAELHFSFTRRRGHWMVGMV